ncbi:MAG: hypothetical protein IJI42_09320 [Methanobrevibacter sp.]|nr:hypothetical protein [Methanobrevibacter sp.]
MTEKDRFIGGDYGFYDQYKEKRLLWSEWKDIIMIMNNLDIKARERGKALSKLQKENEQMKKLTYLIEGFLLDKGYTFEDIIPWLHEKTKISGEMI